MRFGLWYAGVGPMAFPDAADAVAITAERAGFESVWTGDHIVIPAEYDSVYPYSESGRMAADGPIPMAEVIVWATRVTAVTTALRACTGVLVLPQREPVLLATQAASLAVMSGGRFTLGVGSGWLAEEFEAVGASFADRGARTDEYIAAMRALWSQPLASFDGKTVAFDGVHLAPRPTDTMVPVVIGGDSLTAARRAGRLGDGWFPAKAGPGDVQRGLEVLTRAAEGAGRDPETIEVTVHDPTLWDTTDIGDRVERWRASGVDRIVLSPRTLDVAALLDQIETFGEEGIRHVDDHQPT